MSIEAQRVLQLLGGAAATVATAESLTGGRLGALLTSVPGASACYRGGVIAYATELKISLLAVPAELVAEHGVVSGPCAAAMAEGVRRLSGATYGVATTGVAGPDLQEGHRAGTVFVGVSGPQGTVVRALDLSGDRGEIVEATCREALAALTGVIRPT